MTKPANQLHERVKARDIHGMTRILKADPEAARHAQPVCAAGGMAWKEGLALLKRHGADLNALWRGYRPLHALIQEAPHAQHGEPAPERVACLEWLLENGADPQLSAAWPPANALLVATFTGIPIYVQTLRAAGAKVDGFVEAALGDAAKVERRIAKDPAFVQARTSSDATSQGPTALQCAAASRMNTGKTSAKAKAVAQLLLDHGADANVLCKGWSHELDVTYFAANSGQTGTFELLLARGANADRALVQAMWQKDPGKLGEIALNYGANLQQARDGDKPLLNQMIRWGQMKAAFWLLEHGASPNIPDDHGWTAVHQAASRGNERMLQAVLNAGGNLHTKDNEGYSPLDVAKFKKVAHAVQQLLRPSST
jgi:ankyrin repeat protein